MSVSNHLSRGDRSPAAESRDSVDPVLGREGFLAAEARLPVAAAQNSNFDEENLIAARGVRGSGGVRRRSACISPRVRGNSMKTGRCTAGGSGQFVAGSSSSSLRTTRIRITAVTGPLARRDLVAGLDDGKTHRRRAREASRWETRRRLCRSLSINKDVAPVRANTRPSGPCGCSCGCWRAVTAAGIGCRVRRCTVVVDVQALAPFVVDFTCQPSPSGMPSASATWRASEVFPVPGSPVDQQGPLPARARS